MLGNDTWMYNNFFFHNEYNYLRNNNELKCVIGLGVAVLTFGGCFASWFSTSFYGIIYLYPPEYIFSMYCILVISIRKMMFATSTKTELKTRSIAEPINNVLNVSAAQENEINSTQWNKIQMQYKNDQETKFVNVTSTYRILRNSELITKVIKPCFILYMYTVTRKPTNHTWWSIVNNQLSPLMDCMINWSLHKH